MSYTSAPTPLAPTLPPPLLAAVQRVRQAVRLAAERSVESLALSALSTTQPGLREAQLQAQFELQRQMQGFLRAFATHFDEHLRTECGVARPAAADPASGWRGSAPGWSQLALMDNREMEIKVQAERFGLDIAHACEWELRELDGYVGSIVAHARGEREKNPLRPEAIGQGVIRAVAEIAEQPAVARALEGELQRSLVSLMRPTYTDIVADLRKAGVQPASLTVRLSEDRGGHSRSGAFDAVRVDVPLSVAGAMAADGAGARPVGHGHGHAHSAATDGALPGAAARHATDAAGARARSGPIGQVDAPMMDLLRRLASSDAGLDSASAALADAGMAASLAGVPLPNVIRAHRDQLHHAATGALDHMVIDVIGSLFDQILADPKVPPQLARQIARLQLPVLRAALGDPSFFASRRHPVRQFVNRIASLGNGFDDWSDAQAQAFLGTVRDLVQEIVQGDFDRIETYEQRLVALERFVAEQAACIVEERHAGAAALLKEREEALQLGRHYEQRLEDGLQPLSAPAFVRDFVSRVWSRVILDAATREGVTSEHVRELRTVGRELFMSVLPKTSPAQRKLFLANLPKLMQQINAGLNAIGWPPAKRHEFFGQLMPAHASAIKAMAGSVLDFNLMSRRVDQVLEQSLPNRDDLRTAIGSMPVDGEEAADAFSAEEAAQLGFVAETAVDWNGQVDIDLGALEPELQAVDLELPGLPQLAEPAAPARGRSLADHVQIGFRYEMHLEDGWQAVRLAHVSPGRSFFVFTAGTRAQRTISLTYRVLARMCESGRLRAFEQAQLMERAQARARRQLAEMQLTPASALRH